MNEKPKISVVIPTYNRLLLLQKCLESLSNQTFPCHEFEVVVVDDCSEDETRAWLGRKSFPFPLKVLFQEHAGAARARNYGIAESAGRIVVFTDDDCFPCRKFLELHWKEHQRKNHIVGRGPVVIIRKPEEAEGKKVGFSHFSLNFLCTSNASILRENLLKAGEFDEGFGRWEDAELGYRLRRLGLKMSFVPDGIVFHLKPVWKLKKLIETAFSDGKGAARLFKAHPSVRTWFSSGLHPFSLLVGNVLSPVVRRKVSLMDPAEVVSGMWERLIFHKYFVDGLLEARKSDA